MMDDERPAEGGGAVRLRDGGECGAILRGLDWAGHPLRPPEGWPPGLRAALP